MLDVILINFIPCYFNKLKRTNNVFKYLRFHNKIKLAFKKLPNGDVKIIAILWANIIIRINRVFDIQNFK